MNATNNSIFSPSTILNVIPASFLPPEVVKKFPSLNLFAISSSYGITKFIILDPEKPLFFKKVVKLSDCEENWYYFKAFDKSSFSFYTYVASIIKLIRSSFKTFISVSVSGSTLKSLLVNSWAIIYTPIEFWTNPNPTLVQKGLTEFLKWMLDRLSL